MRPTEARKALSASIFPASVAVAMFDDSPKTTTILTIDLPVELGERLRQVMHRIGRDSLYDVTLEALEAWLEREEQKAKE